ncbi:MAG: hypothetical protein FJY75_08295 [Candidatus Eisenbacteria bacterium]|uniref:Uncharacterized protein n=1 Tax=Eiseniibacteriota bacterium TaxID=2212470 RepID=A0A937X967_UNCEI|nr:hypothetical protein [Candidatus Eisenbacteria bacterium]
MDEARKTLRIGLAGLTPGHFDLLALLHEEARARVLWVSPAEPGDTLARLAELLGFPLAADPALAAEVDLVLAGEGTALARLAGLPGRPRIVPEASARRRHDPAAIDWEALQLPAAGPTRATETFAPERAGPTAPMAGELPETLPEWFPRLCEPAGLGAWIARRVASRLAPPGRVFLIVAPRKGEPRAIFDSAGEMPGGASRAFARWWAAAAPPAPRGGPEDDRAEVRAVGAPPGLETGTGTGDNGATGAYLSCWEADGALLAWGLYLSAPAHGAAGWLEAAEALARSLRATALRPLLLLVRREERARRWSRLRAVWRELRGD